MPGSAALSLLCVIAVTVICLGGIVLPVQALNGHVHRASNRFPGEHWRLSNVNDGPAYDGRPCSRASDCLSRICSRGCCGDAFAATSNASFPCVKLKFSGASCTTDADCFTGLACRSIAKDNGARKCQWLSRPLVKAPGPRIGAESRRELQTGPLGLTPKGIPFTLTYYNSQGYRFITLVGGQPMIMDTGSTSFIFCAASNVPAAMTATGKYGCNSYGTGTSDGAATTEYTASPGISILGYSGNTYLLSKANLQIVNSSSGIVTTSSFCASPLVGIWGMAGDDLSVVYPTYYSYPACVTSQAPSSAAASVSSFAGLLATNSYIFGVYLSYTTLQGQVMLGTDAQTIVSETYEVYECDESGSTTHYSFTEVAAYPMVGFYESKPSGDLSSIFYYYGVKMTSCGLSGGAQYSMSGIETIFDTGTQNYYLPTTLYNAIGSTTTGTLVCMMQNTTSVNVNLTIDIDLAVTVASAQGVYTFSEQTDGYMILGVPFFAQYYPIFDINEETVTIYTPPPSTSCYQPTIAPTQRPTPPTTLSPTTHSPSTLSPTTTHSPSTTSPTTTSKPTPQPTTLSPTFRPTSTSPTTTSPTSASPTSALPTFAPITAVPSLSPITKQPSHSPVVSTPKPSTTTTPTTTRHPTKTLSPSTTARPTSQAPVTSSPATAAPTSLAPSASPSRFPSTTSIPSRSPTTEAPTRAPSSGKPTLSPSRRPSRSPTSTSPSRAPRTSAPTAAPTLPTPLPTLRPTPPTTLAPLSNSPTTTAVPTTWTPTFSPSVQAPSATPTWAPIAVDGVARTSLQYLGCFKDCDTNGDSGYHNFRGEYEQNSGCGRVLNWYLAIDYTNMTIAQCRNRAEAAGHLYFGLQDANQCFAGNSLTRATQLGTTTCTKRCSGDAAEICGDYGANSLFMVLPTASPTSSPTPPSTYSPSRAPVSKAPSRAPTRAPSSSRPSRSPSSSQPTGSPTARPSVSPSSRPSTTPTYKGQTYQPSTSPLSSTPSMAPQLPTQQPSTSPYLSYPSSSPVLSSPSSSPSLVPSAAPSRAPQSRRPSTTPSHRIASTPLPTLPPTPHATNAPASLVPSSSTSPTSPVAAAAAAQLPIGAVVGGAVGVLAVIGGALAFVLLRRRRRASAGPPI